MIVGTFACFASAIALCALGYIAILNVGAPAFLAGPVAAALVAPALHRVLARRTVVA